LSVDSLQTRSPAAATVGSWLHDSTKNSEFWTNTESHRVYDLALLTLYGFTLSLVMGSGSCSRVGSSKTMLWFTFTNQQYCFQFSAFKTQLNCLCIFLSTSRIILRRLSRTFFSAGLRLAKIFSAASRNLFFGRLAAANSAASGSKVDACPVFKMHAERETRGHTLKLLKDRVTNRDRRNFFTE